MYIIVLSTFLVYKYYVIYFFFSWKALCLKISDFFCIYRKFLQYDNQLLCGFIALGTTYYLHKYKVWQGKSKLVNFGPICLLYFIKDLLKLVPHNLSLRFFVKTFKGNFFQIRFTGLKSTRRNLKQVLFKNKVES